MLIQLGMSAILVSCSWFFLSQGGGLWVDKPPTQSPLCRCLSGLWAPRQRTML